MDQIVRTLMERYQMTREQAEAYAARIRDSSLPNDTAVRMEALTDTIQPWVDRAKRIAYFNEVNDRYQRGDGVTQDEFNYLQQVKAAEAKRMKENAAAMVAAQKLTAAVGPAVSGALDSAAGFRGEPIELPYSSIESQLAEQLHQRGMNADVEQIQGDDGRIYYSVRGTPRLSPEARRKVATMSAFRPGMEILPDQIGLKIPVKK